MEETLVKRSDYLKVKYKFFIIRLVTYFSFLCIPLWIHYTMEFNLLFQSAIMLIYILFMSSQWYLFGKEIDHRLKIYYRANSSMERIVYRLVLGSIVMMMLFGLISLLPGNILGVAFWIFFSVLGVFYSWPTRGKIIEESMAGQFGEMRYLDSFEKTILILSVLTFMISLPELSFFENTEALKLYFDPEQKVSFFFWGYLEVLYYPFAIFPKLYNLIWCFHFYFVGLGIYLLSFYCIARYFFSRRLSMLGVFAILSTWSFSRILVDDLFSSISTTVTIVWLWSLLWSFRSGTYRSGLLTGLVGCYLVAIDAINILLIPIALYGAYKFFLNDKTAWFKKQWVKYNLLGVTLSCIVVLTKISSIELSFNHYELFVSGIYDLIYRKAFYTISPVGIVLFLIYLSRRSGLLLTYVSFDYSKIIEVLFGFITIVLFGVLIQPSFVMGFSTIWILVFFCLLPIEWIFQSISRLRSKRNLIYAMYILVCLLDSHLENRFRIVGKMFLEFDNLKHFIQL